VFTPSFMIVTGILLGLISIRTLVTIIRNRKEIFDQDFTPSDRQRLSEAAFFILLPLSVIFHELGHAVTVLGFGANVTGYGWYFFYGFVEYTGFLTNAQVFWIALSGNIVSVMLGLIAIAIPVLWPRRPPINYLLFIFGAISIANSLVFYPLLDFVAGAGGDWSQIYSGDTPLLSDVTAVIHAGILIAAVVIWRSNWGRSLYAQRTGLSPDAMRRISLQQAAGELLTAGETLASSWKHPLRVVSGAQGTDAAGVTMHWVSNGYGRAVAAYAVTRGPRHIEIHGAVRQLEPDGKAVQQPVAIIQGMPLPEKVIPILRQALDEVDTWDVSTIEQPVQHS
jgi:hypothetical protein